MTLSPPVRSLLAVAPVLAVLYLCPPETNSFYPRCPIYALTGLLCPGCGATRALSALLHAHLSQARQANPLFVCLLPFALAYLILALRRKSMPPVPPSLTFTLLAVAAVFAVARN